MKKRVNWDKVKELGKLSDPRVAKKYGVSKNAVRTARIRRGIGPAPKAGWSVRKRWDIKWAEMFGGLLETLKTDVEYAKELGCTASLVRYHREAYCLQPFDVYHRNTNDWNNIFSTKCEDGNISFSSLASKYGVCRQTVEAAYIAHVNRVFGYLQSN